MPDDIGYFLWYNFTETLHFVRHYSFTYYFNTPCDRTNESNFIKIKFYDFNIDTLILKRIIKYLLLKSYILEISS